MPLYLLETNVVSDLMTNHPRVTAKASQYAGRLLSSVIVRGEIIDGLQRLPAGRRRRRLEAEATQVLATLTWQPVTEQGADTSGSLKATLARQGRSLGDNDLWIAATALTLGAIVVTRDTDFHLVPGLQVEDWTQ
jgi:tRNA(fMet)-specific endonuclease VapC